MVDATKIFTSMPGDAAPAADPVEQMSPADAKFAAAIYKAPAADKAPALTAAEKLFPTMRQEDHPQADLGEIDKPADTEREPGEPSEAAAELIDALELDTDDPFASTFATAAADLGLDAEGGKRLVDLELAHRQSYWDKQGETWQAEARQLGDERISAARDVVRRYAPTGFDLGPYGNHPGLIRLLSAVAEDLQ